MTVTETPAQTPASAKKDWQSARIASLEKLTDKILRVELEVDPSGWNAGLAGQHLDIRLTAPDGYQAQRSYSLLTPPHKPGFYELAIELLEEGEVSPYFHYDAQVDDKLELRGPIGGYFIWRETDPAPVVLVGGGSGIVPLLAILRQKINQQAAAPMLLVYAARQISDLIYYSQLLAEEQAHDSLQVRFALSRDIPQRPEDYAGRIDTPFMQQVLAGLEQRDAVQCYVCGSNSFVETATMTLIDNGVDAAAIRTERFGE